MQNTQFLAQQYYEIYSRLKKPKQNKTPKKPTKLPLVLEGGKEVKLIFCCYVKLGWEDSAFYNNCSLVKIHLSIMLNTSFYLLVSQCYPQHHSFKFTIFAWFEVMLTIETEAILAHLHQPFSKLAGNSLGVVKVSLTWLGQNKDLESCAWIQHTREQCLCAHAGVWAEGEEFPPPAALLGSTGSSCSSSSARPTQQQLL